MGHSRVRGYDGFGADDRFGQYDGFAAGDRFGGKDGVCGNAGVRAGRAARYGWVTLPTPQTMG